MLKETFRFKSVKPDLPDLNQLSPLLENIQKNGIFTNFGPLAIEFEQRLAQKFGFSGESCVTCSNATSGLSAALIALNGKGKCVVPAFTFPASLGSVYAAGMTPVIIDADEEDWVMSLSSLERCLNETGAKMVMLVSPFGIKKNIEPHIQVCRNYDAQIVIDNAAGLGVQRQYFGEDIIEVFSMHATKPFGIGEGGVIFAPSHHDAAIRAALNFGLSAVSEVRQSWGINGKLSEIHAGIGLMQIDRIDQIVRDRAQFVDLYINVLSSFDIRYPLYRCTSPWQIFPILFSNEQTADVFAFLCASRGVEIRRYYRPSLSKISALNTFEPCVSSEKLSDRMCALPVRRISDSDGEEIRSIVVSALQDVFI
jgi:dTDP-4-amino-4,6-dideoxygalactose transaminase